MKNLQQAADDVGSIAEAVEAVGKLLDRFHARHGEELYNQLESVWPDAVSFGGSYADPLYKLERDLTPTED